MKKLPSQTDTANEWSPTMINPVNSLQHKIAKLKAIRSFKSLEKQVNPDRGPQCSCDIIMAWNIGCQCGRIKWEKEHQ